MSNIYRNALSSWYERTAATGADIRTVKRIGDGFMDIVETVDLERKHRRLLQIVHDSVVIIPVIHFREKIFTVLGDEFRSGAGESLASFPAGRLTPGVSIEEEALRELIEETPIKKEWVTDLQLLSTGERNYSTPGATNEQIHFVQADINLPAGVSLEDINGKHSGLEEEGESITSIVTELNFELMYQLGSESGKLGLLLALNNLRQSTPNSPPA